MLLVLLCVSVHSVLSKSLIKEIIDIRSETNEVMIFADHSPMKTIHQEDNASGNRCSSCFPHLDLANLTKLASFLIRMNHQEPFRLQEVTFPIAYKFSHQKYGSTVLLDRGVIFGVSDFKMVGDTTRAGSDGPGTSFLWLELNHLRATCEVHIDVQGLMVHGRAEVRVSPLLMRLSVLSGPDGVILVKKANSNFEMDSDQGVKAFLKGLGSVPGARKKIAWEIEDKIKFVVNNDVREAIRNNFNEALLRTRAKHDS